MTHIQPIHHSQDAQGPEAALQAAGPPSGFSQHSCPELNGDPSQKKKKKDSSYSRTCDITLFGERVFADVI